MKFKGAISKIHEGGVRAKTDNPEGEKPDINDDCYSPAYFSHEFQRQAFKDDLKEWKEAEAQRKELDVKEGKDDSAFIYAGLYSVGTRIEGEIINNEIVNVKICN